jgi:hypothetical protein
MELNHFASPPSIIHAQPVIPALLPLSHPQKYFPEKFSHIPLDTTVRAETVHSKKSQ